MAQAKVVHTSYLEKVLSPTKLRKTVAALVKSIKASGIEYEAIVCRGSSGLLVAPIVAFRLKKPLILVRKREAGGIYGNKTNSHSGHIVEGMEFEKSFIIIDDLICSGTTINETIKELVDSEVMTSKTADCKAIFLYAECYPRYYRRDYNDGVCCKNAQVFCI